MKRLRGLSKYPRKRIPRLIRDCVIDVVLVTLSLWATYAVASNQIVPANLPLLLGAGAILGMIAVLVLGLRGLYSINVRYIGLSDFLNVVLASFVVMLAMGFMRPLVLLAPAALQSLVGPLFFWGMTCAFLSSVRILRRLWSWRSVPRSDDENAVAPRRTLIIGAGDGGESVLREIRRSSYPTHYVIGLVDDDPEKLDMRIDGCRVLGTTKDIPALSQELRIEELLIAIPSAKGEEIRRIMELCQRTKARVKTMPPVKQMLFGSKKLLRDVQIEDLLRRDPVEIDLESVRGYLSGERVLITGGGGSIGSELARQISQLSPSRLTLLGKGENSIYEIEQELFQTRLGKPHCIIADVRDEFSMEQAFRKATPTVVFHAAAHKHVPLMQDNPIEAIRNNVGGTWQSAEMAIRHGAQKFIFISTDKAVNPSSIMGATKRVGEMIVSALGATSETQFAIVRFGNVLGSRGSLVPLLQAQIQRGGPVRITHPDMTRYFMTIPEAVTLILQAGALGSSGEIFLLDMGQPVKIMDMANDLIRLSGLVPGQDVDIEIIGIRPGEKIHEELLHSQEVLTPTRHSSISMVKPGDEEVWGQLREEVQTLLDLCDQGRAEEARQCLMELAWGRSPSAEMRRLAAGQ